MQFQVPQFIDVAPKIVGPLTLKQFLFLAGAAVPGFLLFFVLQFWLWLIITAVLASLALALAFAKFNGQPMPKILLSAVNYLWQPRFYLWRRVEEPMKLPTLPKFKLAEEKEARPPLKDLMLKLTTTTHFIEKREKPSKFLSISKIGLGAKIAKEHFETFRKLTGERDAARRIDYR